MTGYENLLVVFSHTSVPINAQQQIEYEIIDCGSNTLSHKITLETIAKGLCPLNSDAHLRWVGFSEEGQLMVISDSGIVSALSMKS